MYYLLKLLSTFQGTQKGKDGSDGVKKETALKQFPFLRNSLRESLFFYFIVVWKISCNRQNLSPILKQVSPRKYPLSIYSLQP